MTQHCQWCNSDKIKNANNIVYWELPDGTSAMEIKETPCIECESCQMVYQTEEIIKEIENQLYLINTKELEKSLTYQELMGKQKLLKRNYFDFA